MTSYQIPNPNTTIFDGDGNDGDAVERVLGANELAMIARGHADACACWACICRFATAVEAWADTLPSAAA